MSEILDIEKLKEKIAHFAQERDWQQFHNPKNLAMALTVESSELMEIFQWLNLEEAAKICDDPNKKIEIEDELSDILVYVVRLAGVLNVNLPNAIEKKMKKNALKYPAELVKGSAKKYSEYKNRK
ncbi:MAG: nucleotide pyrophosphohydrolase [Bdellovibrionales bacterium RIFOXYD12_FULL_39_22]|nr:MAG: nucleotide pyrophosphohydrolase [Bdellovibrionales bacterium RIFOXYB1_FULL_39_21]OFZ44507.1 MAG: nucleotide pyrophosphohydrolase [Bdellovibrionales bacterium RIFOXYC12_FULL_39_17]OFZ49851.1 MAG: nucleotide pyrophosphohydrolase [Bdellovibrionales bacterium RIFOXYC1_FULL_39_130]OFZ73006.1 MAG: nucleotide pyrophosphohydrolase [Bdellovibrionales bacterium RIFOXYC2_FULL_39_8]OFZ76856.1 MAG: nucleotide pyrophosphohydrolase [Bdellovibrionales bacterium RIFOXYD1_FULL_39_84]OFZ95783.1 MAG: nucl